MNEACPNVEAVAVSGGKILFAGAEEKALKFKGPQTQIINLGNKIMLPGFIDPHIHTVFALLDNWLDLGPFENGSKMDKVKDRLILAIKDYSKDLKLDVLLTAKLFDPQVM